MERFLFTSKSGKSLFGSLKWTINKGNIKHEVSEYAYWLGGITKCCERDETLIKKANQKNLLAIDGL
jgi:G:T-mismatch repair DNA endonuclease (very short patch repair protein)